MIKYKYKDIEYYLWAETDNINLSDEELLNSFMNIKFYINNDEVIGLNVWTVNYLKNRLEIFVQSQNELLLLPDIVVKSLYKECIKKAIEEYIDEML